MTISLSHTHATTLKSVQMMTHIIEESTQNHYRQHQNTKLIQCKKPQKTARYLSNSAADMGEHATDILWT